MGPDAGIRSKAARRRKAPAGGLACMAALRCGAPVPLPCADAPVCFELTAAPAGDFTLTLAGGLALQYTENDQSAVLRFTDPTLACGRDGERRARLAAPCRSVRVLADASSAEIFLNDGETVFTTRYFPAQTARTVRLDGAAGLLYPLKGEEYP